MIEAINRIEKYSARGRDIFESDELIQTYILHHLQVIGEAAFKMPQDFRERYPEVPWPKMLGMRHILVHGYFEIDLDIVWAVVQKDLPELKRKLEAILRRIGD